MRRWRWSQKKLSEFSGHGQVIGDRMLLEDSAMLRDSMLLIHDFVMIGVLVFLALVLGGSLSHYRPLPPLLESGVTPHLTPPIE
jgi:hypothetical protein